METLDITSFENVLKSLKSVINRYNTDKSDIDIRDAVIQRFEYTYSLSIKMVTRFINLQSNENLPSMTFNETIREANKLSLLKNDLVTWTEYRQNRNMTSHTYNEKVALEVLEIIPQFVIEAEYLLNQLKGRL